MTVSRSTDSARARELRKAVRPTGRLRPAVFHLADLVPLSTSSVAPAFSIAAAYGVMVSFAGPQAIMSVIVAFPLFLFSALIFRQLNIHFPHAGASFFWGTSVIGRRYGGFQAWVVTLAYFLSLPPILLPAGEYTLQLASSLEWVPPSVVGNLEWEAVMGIGWALVAAVPLLLGAKPTARFTEAFFGIEIAILAIFLGIGLSVLPGHVINPIRPSWFFSTAINPLSFSLALVAVATILDGWEIDSYASEESEKPRKDPGIGGIIGAFGALLFYAILYPLMLGETPLHALANSTDPLAVWSQRLVPSAPWIMLIPILLSTAGGLWLTSFILTRALYAMGRERLIPASFAKLNRNHVPHVAVLAALGTAGVVVSLQLFVTSLGSFFNLVLSGAGFFLLAEFLLDSVTGVIFLSVGHRRMPEMSLQPHQHRLLLVGAIFSSVVMAALLIAFFIFGPTAIGNGIDETLAALLGCGFAFAWWTKKRTRETVHFDEHGSELTAATPR